MFEFTKDSITVTANPLDCSTSLTDASFANPPPIAYDSAGSTVPVTNDFSAIFSHSQTTDCPVTSCVLKTAPGCLSPFSHADIQIGVSPLYGLTASETVLAGYSHTFCFECVVTPAAGSASPSTFQKDSITVTANPLDCSTSLIDASYANPNLINYNSAGSSVVVAPGFTAIFTHS